MQHRLTSTTLNTGVIIDMIKRAGEDGWRLICAVPVVKETPERFTNKPKDSYSTYIYHYFVKYDEDEEEKEEPSYYEQRDKLNKEYNERMFVSGNNIEEKEEEEEGEEEEEEEEEKEYFNSRLGRIEVIRASKEKGFLMSYKDGNYIKISDVYNGKGNLVKALIYNLIMMKKVKVYCCISAGVDLNKTSRPGYYVIHKSQVENMIKSNDQLRSAFYLS